MKRYQECNWFHKLWRRRWYLAVPFMAVYNVISKEKVYMDEEVDGQLVHTQKYETYGYRRWYRICIGSAQIKMNYTITQEELEKHMEEWFKNKKDEKI